MKFLKNKQIKRLPVTAFYTGDNGTYCSVLPTTATTDFLRAMCTVLETAGFEPHTPLNFHVTVIHSKTGMALKEQQDAWAALQADAVFRAIPKHVTHWSGHNDTGYIVLELDAPELAEIHQFLKTTFDLETSFPDYRAHITLVEDAYKKGDDDNLAVQTIVNKLNQMLGTNPTPLTFTGIRMEDLKAD